MDSLSQKHCNKCGKDKQISDFYKNRGHKDGLSSLCKVCVDKNNKKWAATNQEKVRAYIKKCTQIHIEKYRECIRKYKEKNRERIREEGRKYWSTRKEEKHEYDMAYQKRNAEKRREQGRKYRAEHPDKNAEYSRNRRARKFGNGGNITKDEWRGIVEKYGNKCLWCGRSGLEVKITIDHVVPLVLGGRHSKDNVQPLCISCNSRKNDKVMDFR